MFWWTELSHNWLDEDEPISTERLLVLPISVELQEGFLELLDNEFVRIHHWTGEMIEGTRRALNANPRSRHQATKHMSVLVTRSEPLVVVGLISVSPVSNSPVGNADLHIGIQMGKEHRNRGYLSEALPLVIDQLEQIGKSNVWLVSPKDNAAMIRVCSKLNFSDRGCVIYNYPDRFIELAQTFQILPRDHGGGT